MNEELHALEKMHTWDLVYLHYGKTLVWRRWVYHNMTHSDGYLKQRKARLVV